MEGGHVDASKLIADTKSGVMVQGARAVPSCFMQSPPTRWLRPVIGIAPKFLKRCLWRQEEMSGSPLCLI